jgi:CRP/FNR family transcriptional regulator, cyclic AMP receptor protein
MSFLDGIKIFSLLTSEEKRKLENFCQERIIKKWEILFSEWEEANCMYILRSWSIWVYKEVDGKQVYFWTVHSEEILWEMALFYNNGLRMATAIAMEDTDFITIAGFSIEKLTQEHPDLLERIQSIIDERTIFNKTLESKLRQSGL